MRRRGRVAERHPSQYHVSPLYLSTPFVAHPPVHLTSTPRKLNDWWKKRNWAAKTLVYQWTASLSKHHRLYAAAKRNHYLNDRRIRKRSRKSTWNHIPCAKNAGAAIDEWSPTSPWCRRPSIPFALLHSVRRPDSISWAPTDPCLKTVPELPRSPNVTYHFEGLRKVKTIKSFWC